MKSMVWRGSKSSGGAKALAVPPPDLGFIRRDKMLNQIEIEVSVEKNPSNWIYTTISEQLEIGESISNWNCEKQEDNWLITFETDIIKPYWILESIEEQLDEEETIKFVIKS